MYKSPLHILSDLNADASEISDPAFLLRTRKRLLAEFNLSDLPTIDINGKPYSKDEVIKMIDVLMGNPQMPLHTYVFANKNLLDYLENDQSAVRPDQFRAMNVPEEIRPMLSSVLLERIAFNLKKAFHTRKFDNATDLIQHTPDLMELEQDLFFEELNKNLLSLLDQIEVVQARDSEYMERDLKFLADNSFARLLNSLPPDFSYMVDSIVTDVINTMVAYQKRKGHHRAYLYEVSVVLCRVTCDSELMKLVKSNHQAFSENNGKNTKSSYGQGIGIGIFILVFVIRLLVSSSPSCDRNSGSKINIRDFRTVSKKSRVGDFTEYRRHILSTETNDLLYKSMTVPVYMSENSSGSNPFLQILKENEVPELNDENLRRVIVKNQTRRDLIVIVFNRSDDHARAFYFFKNKPDTLVFRETDRISLYFGDSLSYVKSTQQEIPAIKAYYEAYFKSVDKNTFNIFAKEFQLTLIKDYNVKKGRSLPVLKFSDSFFENNSIKTSRLEFLEESFEAPPLESNNKLMDDILKERSKERK